MVLIVPITKGVFGSPFLQCSPSNWSTVWKRVLYIYKLDRWHARLSEIMKRVMLSGRPRKWSISFLGVLGSSSFQSIRFVVDIYLELFQSTPVMDYRYIVLMIKFVVHIYSNCFFLNIFKMYS